jgi:hypothetical protein
MLREAVPPLEATLQSRETDIPNITQLMENCGVSAAIARTTMKKSYVGDYHHAR